MLAAAPVSRREACDDRSYPLASAVRQAEGGLAAVLSRGGATLSRREAIGAGGLTIAGAAGLAPATTPAHRIVFGSDRSGYAGLHAAAPLAVGLRWYFDVENHFPAAWPDPFPGTHMTLSLRPNPADLLSGRLDRRLRAIIDSAPAHSELTFWHENTTGNPLHYPRYVNNARTAIRMQHYGHRLCRGTHVRFGVITAGPAAMQLGWMASGLDWYGDDLYDFRRLRNADGTLSKAKVIARMNSNLRAWRRASGRRSPAVRICETNSPFDAHRIELFTTIAHWMAGHNGNRILTYWNRRRTAAHGGLSGPWPPSRPVIRRLRSLSEQYNWTA
jgi:hypothetical protein